MSLMVIKQKENILKTNGKLRGLAIANFEDKIVQLAVKQIVEAIFKPKFTNNMFGFRLNSGCHDVIIYLNECIERHYTNYILNADLKGYFDNINQELIIKGLEPHIKSVEKFNTKLCDILIRSRSIRLGERALKLKQLIYGWVNYFRIADMKILLTKTDEHIRRKLRVIIWKQWKKIRKMYTCLRKLGISHRGCICYCKL